MIYDHTNSKLLFNWLRKVLKVNKPTSAPAKHYKEGDETWDEWNSRVKRDQPFGYFMTETVPDFIDSIRSVYKDPIDNIRHYLINRFRSHIHYLPTGLKPGKYYEVDARMLHGLFQLLVDFIEVEKAGDYVAWNGNRDNKYDIKCYHKMAPFSWFIDWRCPQAGLDRLTYEMTLAEPNVDQWGNDTSSPSQAASAKEQYDLYTWWTVTRPARVDPYSIIGTFYERMEEKYPDSKGSLMYEYNPEETLESNNLYNQMTELERQYEAEDGEMMIRLIKIRNGLWT